MARSIISKPNTDGATAQYPYGKIRDNDGSGNGTPVNTEVYGDFHQFFARLMALASVAFNNLPENATDGFQYAAALQAVIQQHINALKGGVPTEGDTLQKLYTLITAVGRPRGGFDASGGGVPGSASNEAGDFWRITVGGNVPGLISGDIELKPGDLLFSNVDGATTAGQFYAIQSNVDQATSSTLGLVKLYTDLAASNTDGSPNQASIKAFVEAGDNYLKNRPICICHALVSNDVGVVFQQGTITISASNLPDSSPYLKRILITHNLNNANYTVSAIASESSVCYSDKGVNSFIISSVSDTGSIPAIMLYDIQIFKYQG